MTTQWSLKALYESYEDPQFQHCIDNVQATLEKASTWLEQGRTQAPRTALVESLEILRSLRSELSRLGAFVNLSLATNTTDEASLKAMQHIQALQTQATPFQTEMSQFIAGLELEPLLEDEALAPYRYFLTSTKERAQYQLSTTEESLLAALNPTGSSAWNRLHSELTSMVKVPYDGKEITLSDVRNLAHDASQDVRKAAYEAELKAYPQIDRAVASALNAIKGEVNFLAKRRGYDSPLAQAVYQSRMQPKTLDALIAAMEASRPQFHRYLKRKASVLGHANGLPWYDLFAPMGQSSTTFDAASATQYVIDQFATYSDGLAALATRAKEEAWIDFYPKSGKRGGAFCANIHPLKQSRILMNFEGSFSNVITLAHELGHAYHGDQVFKEDILNASYTMPVAETASTLCETIVKRAAIEDATSDDEKRFLIEQSLMGSTQIIIDILSRFHFEKAMFATREKGPLSVERINQLMLDAQTYAYGDALDPEVKHPYMWLNKPHYYSAGLSFYNFPYAFGLLFAKGIFALYQKHGDAFVPKIDYLLQKTGQMSVEEVAASIGIDVQDQAFWAGSLAVIEEEIEQFMALTR